MFAKFRNWALLNPLARLAIAALISVIITDINLGRDQDHLVLMLACVASVAALVIPRWVPLEVPAALVFAFIHLVRLEETRDHPLRAELSGEDRAEAVLTGYLTPAAEGGGGREGGRQQVTVDATDITLPLMGRSIRRPTKLRGWMTPLQRLPPAGIYEIKGRLRLPRKPTNPGQFDSAAYSIRQGIVADFDIRSVRLICLDPFPIRTVLLNAASRSRAWIEEQLAVGIEGEEQALALVRGMVLGVTDDTSAEIQRPFRNSGTLHVFSVSGLHVALISTIGMLFLRTFGMRHTLALLVLIPGVFAYAFITGWRPSAARAAIMITVFLAATLFDRKSRLQNSIGAAALILLGADTHQLFTAGFQLSFGVLFSISVFGGPLVRWSQRWTQLDPFLPPQLASWGQVKWSRCKTWLASSISISTAATIGSLPLMVWHFGLVTPVAIVANCLLIPMAFVVLATACVSLLFASAQLGYALVLSNNANWLFAKCLLGGAVLFSKVPGAYFTWQPSFQPSPRPPTELTVLNLPYGEAAVHLRDADSHWLLDTGSKRSFANIVQPLLQHQRTEVLSGLILSHSDIDHVGGAIRAVSEHGCRITCVGALEPWRLESGASGLKRFLARQIKDSQSVRFLSADDRLVLGPQVTAKVLYPSLRDLHDKGDDRAVVLLIDLEGFRVLWCNDIGFIAEKTIMERNLLKSLRCDVLVRNQHAADFSALPDFLLAVRPKIIVTSNVPSVAEEVMPPSLAAYARKRKATIFDQNLHGAVSFSVTDKHLTATAFVTGETVVLEATSAAIPR